MMCISNRGPRPLSSPVLSGIQLAKMGRLLVKFFSFKPPGDGAGEHVRGRWQMRPSWPQAKPGAKRAAELQGLTTSPD
jgi:hypothetical protein